MSISNKTKAFAALTKFANARTQLIQALHDAGYTLETARDVVVEWACDKCDAAFTVKSNGAVKLDSTHANYERAKTTVRDMMLMIQGTTRREAHAKTEPTDEVAQLLKKIAKLTPADKRRLLKGLNA